MRRALAVMVLALLSLTPTACGGGSKTSVDSGPSARELAASLVEAGDLGSGWTVFTPPEGYGSLGVVTEKTREMVPRMDFCAKASSESRKAATGLMWEAFTQHHFATGSDRHPVFLQEFLFSDRASDVRRTFDLLAAGMRACKGDRSVTPDGETVTQGPLDLPALGQDRLGSRLAVAEPGDNPTIWDVRSVIVRKGTVLIGITIAEIVPPGVQKVLSDEKTTDLMTTIVDKAP
jgi:hypothetical protein